MIDNSGFQGLGTLVVQRRVCKTRYQGFDSPLGLVKILEIVLAGILFLGAFRAIRTGAELVLRAYESHRWALMYQLDSYPSRRLYGYAGWSLALALLLSGVGGVMGGIALFT